jgi:DNA repair protein RadC
MRALHSYPAIRKPREHCLAQGPESLELEELIAIILGSGIVGHPIEEVSEKVGKLLMSGVTNVQELRSIAGIGEARAVQIAAALYLASAVDQRIGSIQLEQPEHIYARMHDLISEPQEHCAVFCISARRREVCREVISIGTTTEALIHPREVYRPAILANAVYVVIAHTHPSGDPTPSTQDKVITEVLCAAGALLGISLLDHVVCAIHGYTSLRQYAPELFS